MRTHLGREKYQIDDEIKRGVLNCLSSQDKTFHAARIRKCQDNEKNA
jgi:hypothetical protein